MNLVGQSLPTGRKLLKSLNCASLPPFPKSLSGAMVYITEWDKFVEQSIELFRADPDSVIPYFVFFSFALFSCFLFLCNTSQIEFFIIEFHDCPSYPSCLCSINLFF